ncbi:MAG: sugar phosphate isomerase/epimerase family protein [Verrucomicrobiota bacterium]
MTFSPTILSRRDFLRLAALSPLALAAGLQAYEPVARVSGPFFKPTVNAYSFLELLNANLKDSTQGMDLFQVCTFCAKHNVEAVDLTGYFFPGYPAPPPDAYVNRIRRFVHDNGMVVSGTGVKNDFATADKSERMAGVQLTKDWIEVASRLGAPVVRVFAGPHGKTNWQAASGNAKREEVEAWMADDLRACAEYGEKFGVIVAVQNHGDFISTGAEHLSLLNRTDHAWCGPLVDTGKYLTENPYEDIALMAPYAVNWQIKETMGSSLKSPRTDFLRLVKIIRNSGYRGYVPIETLAMGRKDYDPMAEVLHVLNAMRDALAASE